MLKRPRDYYDEFSRTYDDGRDSGYHAMVDELEGALALRYAQGRTLEVGCGTGLILQRLAAASNAIGIDFSAGMLSHARARDLRVARASATSLPFRDAAFDLVCSFKVLAHVEPIESAVLEMARVLRPGGYAVLEFYNRWSVRYLAFRSRRGAISADTTEKNVFTRYDRLQDMRRYLPENLQLVSLRGVRVITPHASLLRVPLIGAGLRRLEQFCADAPFLRRWGGFLVLILRKTA